ncbi:threonine--tRNA ligase [Candidatus Albibeggiatoa sp. nov. NOAA]|uniref:threonine--tRNA ligase n=1 Tax=Candidatus Albibeggiatoa sp. nov. NOAA TaxID=3162724 RepID=UPI0032FDDEEF|nr:threonine--tRNA ligase [Thiotrichaceae bacterium]
MPIITLPDGSQRQFDQPVTVVEVAANISKSLSKAALAGKLNGTLVDTSTTITDDAELAIITEKDPEGVDIIRHSCAHLMAQAVKQLYPETQVTIGPVIENGFYYDFAREEKFTPEDLAKIEAKMQHIVKQNLPVERSVMVREEAIEFFKQQGEQYKAEIISDIPEGQEISLYKQGDFIDLCRGPHVPSTSKIKAFKLQSLAGAYWRGDSDNEMLQRIYGTAWGNKKDLTDYLHRLEEAEKRDHRKLGKQLDLFHFQEEAPGMVFWHPKGWALYRNIENYMRKRLNEYGYQEVNAPVLLDRSLWEKSGHWDKFAGNMFISHFEDRDYVVKPMNCPGHIQIFNQGLTSYRQLPFLIAEFGLVHRNEASGTLHGLMRARRFVQDDAHVFCTEDQLQEEVTKLIDFTFAVYKDFGFEEVLIKLSTRPEKRVGNDEVWDKAEKALEIALDNKGLDWDLQPGEGAFYGPKIEFTLKDCIGRLWQCGTIQVDFSMPGRLGAEYVAADGSKQVPVMIHRAILGSLERFSGILIEHYAGAFPTWLAPMQVSVLNITDAQADYAQDVTKILRKNGFKVESDLRNEKIGLKIREHTLQKVPYLLVVGKREMENQQVAVRTRGGEDLGAMPLNDFIAKLNAELTDFI